ncbi:MAG: hypothetical protein CME64_16985 [Halobacteriovoraceae bacterium]|nr:hypothetical protein [Halobacteriovoraceae bacterium]|tara:strand:+ start:223227 stop:224156 length:930 start_codon:yes stop_codon:yes gene_type:complete
MKRLIYILIFISLLSCTVAKRDKNRLVSSHENLLKFNMSLIHTLSSNPTSEDIHPSKLPYCVKYKLGTKELIYLSTNHTSDVQSKTHKAIDFILKEFKPSEVIVEIPPFQENPSDSMLKRCDLEEKCVEGLYAYKKSKILGIDVTGGEPQHIEVLKNSLELGISEREMMFFYTYRGVASWRQGDADRAYDPDNPRKEIESYIKNNKKRLGLLNIKFDYNDFVSIYENNMNAVFNYKNSRYYDIAPYKDGHYIQKLSVIVDKTREETILEKTEELINRSSKVFIIYGSGHFLKHRPVLKEAFKYENVISL